MPLLTFTMRSQDLDGGHVADNGTQHAKKTIRLERPFKMKYLKLLHIYHNISYTSIHNTANESTMGNTILFAKISFLNSNNSIVYESVIESDGVFRPSKSSIREHNGFICLGETIKEENMNTFRDAYKVLHDGQDKLYINAPFTIELYQLGGKDPAHDNESLSDYNDMSSHLIEPVTQDQFRGPLNQGGHYVSFIFEYVEDYQK